MDFVVIIRVRQRFGIEDASDVEPEAEAPFVGKAKNFPFNCPRVDPGADAILLFQAMGVGHRRNRLAINGSDIAGGLPIGGLLTIPTGQQPTTGFLTGIWSAQVLIVPAGVLRETGNTLRIEARNKDGGTGGEVDSFIVDNVVLLFKPRRGGVIDPV
jgi:hypothetical protein